MTEHTTTEHTAEPSCCEHPDAPMHCAHDARTDTAPSFPATSALGVVLAAAENYTEYLGEGEYSDPDDGDIATDAAEAERIATAVEVVRSALATVLEAAADWQQELVDYVIPGAEAAADAGDDDTSTAGAYGVRVDAIADARDALTSCDLDRGQHPTRSAPSALGVAVRDARAALDDGTAEDLRAEDIRIVDALCSAADAVLGTAPVFTSYPGKITLDVDTGEFSGDAEAGTVTDANDRPAERGRAPGSACGTEGCDGVARWIPIAEGNRGSRVYRCTECCDAVNDGELAQRRAELGAADAGVGWCCGAADSDGDDGVCGEETIGDTTRCARHTDGRDSAAEDVDVDTVTVVIRPGSLVVNGRSVSLEDADGGERYRALCDAIDAVLDDD